MTCSSTHRLVVLGGSSVATPVLLLALLAATRAGRLPPMRVRLWGRAMARMAGIVRYAQSEMARLGYVQSEVLQITTHSSLTEALEGASWILCQVRPGGMAGRARDERFALALGVPADEGLGPGGLSAFVHGRAVMEDLLRRCAQVAPQAVFFQMTGPLGVMTALARRYYPSSSYGICELPMTVSRKVLAEVGARLSGGPFTHAVTGVNHCSWLHAFRDRTGEDRTEEFVNGVKSEALVGVAPGEIRRFGAVPVPYLRLFIHAAEVLREQIGAGQTRGEALGPWSDRLDTAYRDPRGVPVDLVRKLLAERRINWYEDGVIRVMAAFAGREETLLPLNLPASDAVDGIPAHAIVENDCTVSDGVAKPVGTPPLPPGPADLTRALVRYEQRVLALPEDPDSDAIAAVLRMHPLLSSVSPPRTAMSSLFCTTQKSEGRQ